MKMKYLMSSVLRPMQSSLLHIKYNHCQLLVSKISFRKVTVSLYVLMHIIRYILIKKQICTKNYRSSIFKPRVKIIISLSPPKRSKEQYETKMQNEPK